MFYLNTTCLAKFVLNLCDVEEAARDKDLGAVDVTSLSFFLEWERAKILVIIYNGNLLSVLLSNLFQTLMQEFWLY